MRTRNASVEQSRVGSSAVAEGEDVGDAGESERVRDQG